jgi:hypothetical protein
MVGHAKAGTAQAAIAASGAAFLYLDGDATPTAIADLPAGFTPDDAFNLHAITVASDVGDSVELAVAGLFDELVIGSGFPSDTPLAGMTLAKLTALLGAHVLITLATGPTGTVNEAGAQSTTPFDPDYTMRLEGTYTLASGPTVTRVTPVQGRTAGGRLVRITGTGFSGTPVVLFDGDPATDVLVFNSTRLTARTPAHVAGLVDVEVDGVVLADAFTFTDTVFGDLTIREEQGIVVDDTLNDAPNTANFRANATGNPTLGQTIRITDPASGAILFGGTALILKAGIDAQPANPGHRDVTCGDLAWRLNAKRPHGTWVDTSWSDVVQELFDLFAPDFVPDIEASLPTVSLKFDRSKTFTECLSEGNRLARANFVADDDFGVKLFTVDTADPPDAITDATPLYDPPPTATVDLTQVRTRIYVHGAGGADSFEAGVSGPETGGASTPDVTATTGGAIPSGSYGYWISYVTAGGETTLFPLSAGSYSPIVNPGTNAYSLTDLDSSVSPDLRVTGRRIWRTKSAAGYPVGTIGPEFQAALAFLVATLGNIAGVGEDTVLDGAADAALTVRAPKADTTGTVFEMVEDVDAQIALAALLNVDGGTDDGVRDGYIHDPSLTTPAMAIARGQAELAIWKYAIVTVVVATRDPKFKSGQDAPVTLTNPPVSGTFKVANVKIDQVAIDGLEGMTFPRFTATLTSARFTLDDLLRGVVLFGGGGGGGSSSSGGGGVPPAGALGLVIGSLAALANGVGQLTNDGSGGLTWSAGGGSGISAAVVAARVALRF